MTASGLFCRVLLGQTPAARPIMKPRADLILTERPKNLNGSIDHYYWYYASHALYQFGGRHWKTWCELLAKAVVTLQSEHRYARLLSR